MSAVVRDCSVPSRAGWDPVNEDLDHGEAEPGETWHEKLSAQ